MKVYVVWHPVYQVIIAVFRNKTRAYNFMRRLNENKSLMLSYAVDEFEVRE